MFNVYTYSKLKKEKEESKSNSHKLNSKEYLNNRDKMARNHQDRVKKFMIDVSQ